MNIRSLTGFLALGDSPTDSALHPLQDLPHSARSEFSSTSFPIQTSRLAIQSIAELAPRGLCRFAPALGDRTRFDFKNSANAQGMASHVGHLRVFETDSQVQCLRKGA